MEGRNAKIIQLGHGQQNLGIDYASTKFVAKEYSQVGGVDFKEAFNPVAKFITIVCIFTIEAAMDWKIHHVDVKATFLNGEFDGDLCGSTQGIRTRGEETSCVQSRENIIWP